MAKKAKKTLSDKIIKVLIIVILACGALYLQIKLISILDELQVNIFGNHGQEEALELPPVDAPPVIEELPIEPVLVPEPEVVEKTVVIEKIIQVPVQAKAPVPLAGSIFQD